MTVIARLALGVALGYVVSPVQLIPNIILVIGQTDDLAVVTLALRYACRGLPRDEVRAAWPGNPDHLDRLLGRPASVRWSLMVHSDRSPRRVWASDKRRP